MRRIGLDTRACIDHYCGQSGGQYFSSQFPLQRGYGLFSALRRFAIPILKKTGKYFGKRLLATGQNILEDIDQGQSFKDAARKRFLESASQIKDDVIRKIQGGGNKRKRRSRKIQTKRRKKSKKDVFS